MADNAPTSPTFRCRSSRRRAGIDSCVVASMCGTGNCYDNAVEESFFSALEFELIMRLHWATPAEARSDVFEYVEGWYNPRRRHSTLGYLSPADYEGQVRKAA